MPAREKLNAAYFTGSVIAAGVVGMASSSWLVFAVALGVLIAANLIAGEIRPTRGR